MEYQFCYVVTISLLLKEQYLLTLKEPLQGKIGNWLKVTCSYKSNGSKVTLLLFWSNMPATGYTYTYNIHLLVFLYMWQ